MTETCQYELELEKPSKLDYLNISKESKEYLFSGALSEILQKKNEIKKMQIEIQEESSTEVIVTRVKCDKSVDKNRDFCEYHSSKTKDITKRLIAEEKNYLIGARNIEINLCSISNIEELNMFFCRNTLLTAPSQNISVNLKCLFCEELDFQRFPRIKIEKKYRIRNFLNIKKEIRFMYNSFNNLCLPKTRFQKSFMFTSNYVENQCNIEKANFESSVVFDGSVFQKKFDSVDVTFNDSCSFSDHTAHITNTTNNNSKIIKNPLKFKKGANFSNITVEGDFRFSNINLQNNNIVNLDFESSNFKSKVNFEGTDLRDVKITQVNANKNISIDENTKLLRERNNKKSNLFNKIPLVYWYPGYRCKEHLEFSEGREVDESEVKRAYRKLSVFCNKVGLDTKKERCKIEKNEVYSGIFSKILMRGSCLYGYSAKRVFLFNLLSLVIAFICVHLFGKFNDPTLPPTNESFWDSWYHVFISWTTLGSHYSNPVNKWASFPTAGLSLLGLISFALLLYIAGKKLS